MELLEILTHYLKLAIISGMGRVEVLFRAVSALNGGGGLKNWDLERPPNYLPPFAERL
jgi:hypothetical protein